MKHAGVRVDADAAPHARRRPRLVDSLARHVPAALERGGEAARRRHAKVAGDGAPAADARAPPLGGGAGRGRVGRAARRARHVHRRRPAVPRARVRRRASGPRTSGRFHYYVVRDARGQGRAGHVLHGGAVEGRHDGLRRGLRAGRAAPRRGPVLPDVDDVRDGLAADRGRPPLPGPQRGLEGRAGPADGRGLRAREGRGRRDDRPARPARRRPRAGRGRARARLRARPRCRTRWSTSRSRAATRSGCRRCPPRRACTSARPCSRSTTPTRSSS